MKSKLISQFSKNFDSNSHLERETVNLLKGPEAALLLKLQICRKSRDEGNQIEPLI